MSTFCGLFEEIPFISADRFEDKNLNSKLFFLSHCHTDHMQGLFENRTYFEHEPIYCSEVSAVILKKRFPNLQDIRTLEIGVPTELEYTVDNNSYKLVATTFPARHCPGSIMILFETETQKILYTGDFRLRDDDLKKVIPQLENSELDAIYMDTTFFHKNYADFPSQNESVNTICKLIRDWVKKGKDYIVKLYLPARYGSEFLLIEIWQKLKLKIHVNDHNWEAYIYFPTMDECITRDGKDTQIHCCKFRSDYSDCPLIRTRNSLVRTISPSALSWKCWNPTHDMYSIDKYGTYRVIYSNHSSYNEIVDFIQFTKPKSIKCNVLLGTKNEQDEMYRTLDKILGNKPQEVISNNNSFTYKFNNIACITKPQEIYENDIILPKRLKHK